MVQDATSWCDFLIATKSLFVSLGRKAAVHLSYDFRVSTGHNVVLCGKEGKKNSLRSLPCEDCFTRVAGRKTTPSGL